MFIIICDYYFSINIILHCDRNHNLPVIMKSFNLNINHQNVCYLIGKMDDIKVQVQKSTKLIHILCISETHLEEKMDDTSIELPQYTFIRRDKQHNLHTGLVVYIHNSVCKSIKSL